jgi:hypothetical protein
MAQDIYNMVSMELDERGYDMANPIVLDNIRSGASKQCAGRNFVRAIWVSRAVSGWRQPSSEYAKNTPAVVVEINGGEYCVVYHGAPIAFGKLLLSSAFLDGGFTKVFGGHAQGGSPNPTGPKDADAAPSQSAPR